MRDIKFRGKQTKPIQSIWHYGDLMHSRDNKTYIQNFCLMEVDAETVRTIYSDYTIKTEKKYMMEI